MLYQARHIDFTNMPSLDKNEEILRKGKKIETKSVFCQVSFEEKLFCTKTFDSNCNKKHLGVLNFNSVSNNYNKANAGVKILLRMQWLKYRLHCAGNILKVSKLP